MSASKKPTKQRGLGRGLSALMSDVAPALEDERQGEPESGAPAPAAAAGDAATPSPAATGAAATGVTATGAATGMVTVSIHTLARNPDQPRLRFDKDRLAELANSLKERGVLQPILVRPLTGTSSGTKADYQIVAGERRYQAALLAKIDRVPVIVRELTDRDVLEIGVIENVQRANLNPMEEARAYAKLATEFGRKHDEIATAIGKSRPYVSNAIRLTQLPARAQDHILDGTLTAGHARAILGADDPAALTDAIVSRGLSVREAENQAKPSKRRRKTVKSAELRELERRLEEALGAEATLTETRGGRLTLKLVFAREERADEVIETLLG